MDYDYITQLDEDRIYGTVRGNGRIVFIKAGLGGDHLGDECKYLKIARRLWESFGCSVIVGANPYDNKSHVEADRRVIEDYISESGFESPELFFFGHSNGGIKGLELADSGLRFSKMILVNMPLMINFHKTKKYISNMPDTSILAVYGEGDPSFSYLPFIRDRFENLTAISVSGADHNFSGMLNDFIKLADNLFEDKEELLYDARGI